MRIVIDWPTMPLLELKNISHAYGSHAVVSDLSCSLEEGAIGCLLGPSGCGKTTVLRAIAGFERVGYGEIHLNDVVVSSPGLHLPPEQRRIGMVFQDYALFPHLDVADNIAFGLHMPAKRNDARASRNSSSWWASPDRRQVSARTLGWAAAARCAGARACAGSVDPAARRTLLEPRRRPARTPLARGARHPQAIRHDRHPGHA